MVVDNFTGKLSCHFHSAVVPPRNRHLSLMLPCVLPDVAKLGISDNGVALIMLRNDTIAFHRHVKATDGHQ